MITLPKVAIDEINCNSCKKLWCKNNPMNLRVLLAVVQCPCCLHCFCPRLQFRACEPPLPFLACLVGLSCLWQAHHCHLCCLKSWFSLSIAHNDNSIKQFEMMMHHKWASSISFVLYMLQGTTVVVDYSTVRNLWGILYIKKIKVCGD